MTTTLTFENFHQPQCVPLVCSVAHFAGARQVENVSTGTGANGLVPVNASINVTCMLGFDTLLSASPTAATAVAWHSGGGKLCFQVTCRDTVCALQGGARCERKTVPPAPTTLPTVAAPVVCGDGKRS